MRVLEIFLFGPLAHEAEDNHGHADPHPTGQHVQPDGEGPHLTTATTTVIGK